MAAADQSLEAAESWLITGVLCAALLFGLIGLAAHFLWIVAIIIMALGLGYIVANSRRDRIDVINQQADEHPGPPRAALTGRTDSKRHAPRGAWRRVIQLEVAIQGGPAVKAPRRAPRYQGAGRTCPLSRAHPAPPARAEPAALPHHRAAFLPQGASGQRAFMRAQARNPPGEDCTQRQAG